MTSADRVPLVIQVRRCSRADRATFAATGGVHSTPDLHVDGLRSDESPPPGWTSPGGHLRAGTPPERRARRLDGPHHSRSQSCRAPRKTDYLMIPDALGRCRSTTSVRDAEETAEPEYYRLRHFSVTGKGVVNCGDSFRSRRSRSNVSVASDCSEYSPRAEQIHRHAPGWTGSSAPRRGPTRRPPRQAGPRIFPTAGYTICG
ncbi:uncharacterized protein LOC119098404 [Pollicipes pollicipes]|uniref:uncharacterized protein LOC119098404 n=1 Tax=Pollicipes pollicipes TaxID=41117 RepID=UPI0018854B82|nr:uncharacterized protein LOC119098404 [Pollicipes pollicipes]